MDGHTNATLGKMIQHDAADPPTISNESTTLDDIDRIPKDTDDFQRIAIHLEFPYFLLKKIRVSMLNRFGENGPTLIGYLEGKMTKWAKELEMDHHVGSSLSFKGSFPRIDVLKRLYSIATELETWPEFPKFKRNHLESIIGKIIGRRDPRTTRAYFDCLIGFVERKNGGRLSFYADYDLSSFKETVESALTRPTEEK